MPAVTLGRVLVAGWAVDLEVVQGADQVEGSAVGLAVGPDAGSAVGPDAGSAVETAE